jgi:phosphoglycerol transferase
MWIYSSTNYCGDGFLGCARIINALVYVSASIFIFLVAKKVTSGLMAVLVAIFSIIGPFSIFTSLFIPESLYFFGFWVFSWQLLNLTADSQKSKWMLAGFLFGCTWLVKPHSLFFTPAILFYVIYVFQGKPDRTLFGIVEKAVAFFGAAATTRFLVGFLLAGKSGVLLFGSFYSRFAGRAFSDSDLILKFLELVLQNSLGHFVAITIMYGVPFLILLSIVTDLANGAKIVRAPLDRISVFAILVVSNLILVTIAFTALAAINLEMQIVLHTRYYFFALPFFLIITATAVSSNSTKLNRSTRIFLALQLGISCYAIFGLAFPFVHLNTDLFFSPDFYGIRQNLPVCVIFSLMALVVLGLCFWKANFSARIYLFFMAPLLVVSALVHSGRSESIVSSIGDRAGLFVRDYLSEYDRNGVGVVGTDYRNLCKALFHISSPGASMVCHWGTCDLFRFPSMKWVLFIGDKVRPKDLFSELIPMDGFTLARVSAEAAGSYRIDFRRATLPGIVRQIRRLPDSGRDGAKGAADKIEIEFAAALPPRFEVTIQARLLDADAGENFVAKVGNSELPFALKGNSDRRVVLEFDNPARYGVLSLETRRASAAESSGSGGDSAGRRFELTSMEIRPIYPASDRFDFVNRQ